MTDQYGQRMAGAGRERLVQATAANSDANGLIAFRLGPAPLGYVWQGSVTITNAPSGALFNASVASTPWGQWAGPTNFGPVQCWGNETLTVAGVGLLPSTQYTMLFFGVAMPEELADPLPPVAPLSTVSVETTTLLVNAVVIPGAAGTGPTFQPPTLTRRLTIIIDATSQVGFTEIDVIGVQTGTVYTAVNPTAGTPRNNIFFCAIEPAVDQTYKISSSVGGGSVKVWVLASTTNPMVATNPSEPLSVVGTAIPGTPAVSVTFAQPVITVGTIDRYVRVILGVGNNQVVIAAPGVGNSLVIQSLEIHNGGGGGGNAFFHDSGAGFCFLSLDSWRVGGIVDRFAYPNGLKVNTNSSLQADVAVGTVDIAVTYRVSPT